MAADEAEVGDVGAHRCPAYREDPIPQAVIRETFDRARWAPCWRSLEGWHIWVLEGAVLEGLKDELVRRLLEDGPASAELDAPDRAWPELCLARTARLMAAHEEEAATAALEGSREEKLTRLGRLFGAPCLMVYGIDCHVTGTQGCIDSGAFVQSMCEAAHAEGLETCVMATAVRYPDLLHAILPDEAHRLFVVGVALGYPDAEAAVRRYPSEPAEFDELVSWVE
jgi:nitroreductase